MDSALRDLIEEARRIRAAECHSVACTESEARAELCLHMEVGYKRLGLLHTPMILRAKTSLYSNSTQKAISWFAEACFLHSAPPNYGGSS